MKTTILYYLASLLACSLFLINHDTANADENVSKNPFLKRYSKILYDSDHLNEYHNRMKRSLNDDETINFSFESHGRVFNLKLNPSKIEHLDTDHAELDNGKMPLKDFKFYKGILLDEPNSSKVTGTIIDGIFVGTIKSEKNGQYFIESSKRYDDAGDAHAIIYHENDINTGEQLKKAKRELIKEFDLFTNKDTLVAAVDSDNDLNGDVGCGSTQKIHREKLKQEQERITELVRKKRAIAEPSIKEIIEENDSFKYSKEANLNAEKLLNRKKRQSNKKQFPNGQSVCSLYLRIDPLMYKVIYNKEGNQNDATTHSFLISYLIQQVDSLNAIFTPTQFIVDSSNYYSGLSFKIAKIKIFNSNQCGNPNSTLTSIEQNLCTPYLDPVTFLSKLALENYTDFCTAYTFTARDYADGTLGLAYLATNTGSVGGYCEKPVPVNGVTQSLNSGMVTVINFNARMPDRVQQITFAHEMGHNFGSTHDSTTDSTCTPGGNAGNYIMYSRATSGKLANNDEFSSCSQKLMGSVMDYVVTGSKNCLKTVAATTGAICGNGIVEDSEQCDYSVFDNDICCTTDCTLAINPATGLQYTCSPSKGPCCNFACQYRQSTEVCQSSTDCISNVTCTGNNYTCPASNPFNFKPDNSLCNQGSQVCKNGTCTGSLCNLISGLKDCSQSGNLTNPQTDKSSLCLVSCSGSITNNQCLPTSQINGFGSAKVSLRPGSTCAGTQGYCDMFGVCRSVDANTAFARLLSTLISPKSITLEDIKAWAIKYWWAILIFCIVFLAFNVLIVFCATKHMRSDNPNKNNPRKFKDTLKNPFSTFKSTEQKTPSNKRRKLRQDSQRARAKEIAPNIVSDEYRASTSRSNRDASARSARSQRSQRGSTRRNEASPSNRYNDNYEL